MHIILKCNLLLHMVNMPLAMSSHYKGCDNALGILFYGGYL